VLLNEIMFKLVLSSHLWSRSCRTNYTNMWKLYHR